MIALLFFGAFVSALISSGVQVLAEESPDSLRRFHARVSNIAFAAAEGAVVVALSLWNLSILFGTAAS